MNNDDDVEKFIKFYKQFGIEIVYPKLIDNEYFMILPKDVVSGHEKLDGYCDFYTKIVFNRNGKFTKQGFWE